MVSNCNEWGGRSDLPFLRPRLEAVGDSVSLRVGFEEAGNVVVDVGVDLCKLFRFEWFSYEVSRSPFFEGVVVLSTESGYVGVEIIQLTLVAANATIVNVTVVVHSSSPPMLIIRDLCHLSSS